VRYNSHMNNQILSDSQIESEVSKLNVGWAHIPGEGLVRVIETQSFGRGLELVARIGQVAERLGCYPEVTLRAEEVDVTAFDADAGGVTQADIDLARALDAEL
jgi:4a-hydroxytetrahydrobiopterin dehydratase